MPSPFIWQRRVEFQETDAAGIAHFSSLIVYMEQAEHALLRSLGLSVASHAVRPFSNDSTVYSTESLPLRWPRVHVEVEFESPAKFEDVLTIETCIAALGQSSVSYAHCVKIDQLIVATGKMKCVCCLMEGAKLVSFPIPGHVRERLTQHWIP